MSARLAVAIGLGAAVAVAIRRKVATDVLTELLQRFSPLVVPIDDPLERVTAIGESHPATPQLAGGRLIVPVENAGLGPAVNVRGSLVSSDGRIGREKASIAVLAPGRRAALLFGTRESLGDFDLELTFDDSAGHAHTVTASWNLRERAYSVTR